MDNATINNKLKMANLGKTYAYVLVSGKHNLYAPDKQLILFPNKLDAMVVKNAFPDVNYEIVKFNDLDSIVKKLLLMNVKDGKLKVGVMSGYITSNVNQRPQLVVGKTGGPCFHVQLYSNFDSNIDDGIDLADYFMECVISDEIDEQKAIQQLVFSNLCSDKKLQEVAELVIHAARVDGLQTDKQISIRHIFASENPEYDLKNIWGLSS